MLAMPQNYIRALKYHLLRISKLKMMLTLNATLFARSLDMEAATSAVSANYVSNISVGIRHCGI